MTSPRSRRRSGPTWNARSTSSRKLRGGSASRRFGVPSPGPGARSAGSPTTNVTPAPGPTRWWGRGCQKWGRTRRAPPPRPRAPPARPAEESVLRTRILPGLLRSVAHNLSRGLPDVGLFETGRVFLAPPPGAVLPEERNHLAAVLAGTVRRQPVEGDRFVDAFDAVDPLGAVLDALEIAAGRPDVRDPP